jgi:NADH:ubiquinone oxidoreductase subunit C
MKFTETTLEQMKKTVKARLIAMSYNGTHMIYHFQEDHCVASYKVKVGKSVKTVTDVWPNAGFYEREIHEIHGIDFPGNKNLKPLFSG